MAADAKNSPHEQPPFIKPRAKQNMNSTLPLNYVVKGTIKTTGKAHREVPPDTIELGAYLKTEAVSSKESLELLMLETKKLQQAFKAAGFEADEIHTGRVAVDEVTKTTKDRRYLRVGYSTRIQISVTTPLKVGILGALLQAVAKSGCQPELRVGYFVKDPDTVRKSLIEEATRDALQRARSIAAATGQAVGCLVRATDEESARSSSRSGGRPLYLCSPAGDNHADLGSFIEDNPDDIDFETSVICSFEILGEA